MKKMKKCIGIILIAVLLLLQVFPIEGFAATTTLVLENEIESNNTMSSANPINLNTEYTGAIQYKDDQDYYKFTLKNPGTVNISFKHDKLSDDKRYWNVYILDSNGNSNYNWYAGGQEDILSNKMDLPSGDYYIKVTSADESSSIDYNLSIICPNISSYSPNPTPLPKVDNKITLMGISKNQTISGTVNLAASYNGTLKEVGYYIIPANGSKNVSPVVTSNNNNSWQAVYDTNKLQNGEYDIIANGLKEDGSVVYGESVRVTINNIKALIVPKVSNIQPGDKVKGAIIFKATVIPSTYKKVSYYLITKHDSENYLGDSLKNNDDWAFEFDSTQYENGSYQIKVTAYLTDGTKVVGDPMSFEIDNPVLRINILNDKNSSGNYSEGIYISADAINKDVTSVEYYVDNNYFATGYQKNNFEVLLNTRFYEDGNHTITANGKTTNNNITLYGPSIRVSFKNPIKIKLNGEYIISSLQPYIDTSTNRLMVPLSTIKDIFYIGIGSISRNTIVAKGLIHNDSLIFTVGSSIIKCNNKNINFGTKVTKKNGYVYIPIKFFIDTYGAKYNYDKKLKCLELNFKLNASVLKTISKAYNKNKNTTINKSSNNTANNSKIDNKWHKIKSSNGKNIGIVTKDKYCILMTDNIRARHCADGGTDVAMDIYNVRYLKVGNGFWCDYSPAYIDALVEVYNKNNKLIDIEEANGYRIDSSVYQGMEDITKKWYMQTVNKYDDIRNPWYSQLTQISEKNPIHIPRGGRIVITKGDNYATAYNLLRMSLDSLDVWNSLKNDNTSKKEKKALEISLMQEVVLPVLYSYNGQFKNINFSNKNIVKSKAAEIEAKIIINLNEWCIKKIKAKSESQITNSVKKLIEKMAKKKTQDYITKLASNITLATKLVEIFETSSKVVDLFYQIKDIVYNYCIVEGNYKYAIIYGNYLDYMISHDTKRNANNDLSGGGGW